MIKKKIVNLLLNAAVILGMMPFVSSCSDSFIYEYEGDCRMKVKFEFTKHRQALQTFDGVGPDAFAKTVTSVHLFVLDAQSGDLVFEQTESTSNLIDGCIMPVDLDPGEYTFIAWCGLDSNDENNAFELQHKYGSRAGEDGKLSLKMANATEPVHKEKYDDVYHGIVRNFTVNFDNMGEIVTVPVVKDTNDLNIWIQHPYASLDKGDYYVVYEDANGEIDFTDNVLISEDKQLSYKAYETTILQSNTQYNGEMMESGTMIVHMSVSRLMANHAENARLVIRNNLGTEVFAIPFIKFVLGLQTFTKQDTEKDEQWYLDCEDTYNVSFFFTGYDQTWTAFRIIVNNWVVVPDQDWESGPGQD